MPSQVVRSFEYKGLARTGRLPIAAAQTFKKGDFLAVNASGQLVSAIAAAGSDFPSWTSGITNLIVGVAVEDAQPASGDPTILPNPKLYGTFIVAEPGTRFRVPLYHATAASAYPNPSFVGNQYNFSLQTITGNTVWCVRVDLQNKPVCQIVDFVEDMYPGWPDVGQAAPPSSGSLSQYCDTWIEILGGASLLTAARPVTRSN